MVEDARVFTIRLYVLSFYAWLMLNYNAYKILNYNAYKNIVIYSKTDIYESFRILTSEVFSVLCGFQHIHQSYTVNVYI